MSNKNDFQLLLTHDLIIVESDNSVLKMPD